MTQSERRLEGVSEMTAERLAELRRIAEAATVGRVEGYRETFGYEELRVVRRAIRESD